MATNIEIISSILGFRVLPLSLQRAAQKNPKAFKFLLDGISGTGVSAEGGVIPALSMFTQRFESEAALLQQVQIRIPHNALSKDLIIGSEFMQYARAIIAKNMVGVINTSKSRFHVLDDGNVVLLLPEIYDGYMLEETDIFRIFCEQRQNINWNTLPKNLHQQLQDLGYVSSDDKQFALFSEQGNSKPVSGAVLTKEGIGFLFGSQISSLPPSPWLQPLATMQPSPAKKKQNGFLEDF